MRKSTQKSSLRPLTSDEIGSEMHDDAAEHNARFFTEISFIFPKVFPLTYASLSSLKRNEILHIDWRKQSVFKENHELGVFLDE